MTSKSAGNPMLIVRALTVAAMVLIGFAYVSPIWWVSLKAPNYPAETFPDGIRIHFHVNAVTNGCTARPASSEVDEQEPLDCVHEMNTINHFIGMHPIAEGAHLEQAAAPYLFALVEIMLAVFLIYGGRFWWVLPLSGIVIPVIFVIDYSAWLWWFGHTLNPWGAFTVKPFMPTVFGEGKVAQFSTYSYPHYGFGLLVAASFCLTLAALLRRKMLRQQQ